MLEGPAAKPALSLRRPIGRGPRGVLATDPACVSTRRRARSPAPAKRNHMKRTTAIGTLLGALLLSAAAWGISAAVDTPPSLMARSDHDAARAQIESDARQALSRCRDLEGQAKDVCRAEARADERIRKADLEARYRGTIAAAAEAKAVHAKAQYDVAKARCGAEHGSDKLACMRTARDEKAKALSAAKVATNPT